MFTTIRVVPVSLAFVLIATAAASEPQPSGKRDAAGDPLPPGAVARLGTTRLRHGGLVACATFSADGKTLTSLGGDNVLRTWNVSTGEQLRQCRREAAASEEFGASCFSPDGKQLAIGNFSRDDSPDRLVWLFDVATGKKLREFIVRNAGWQVERLAFSPDGKLLAAGNQQHGIDLWETVNGKHCHRMEMNAMVTALTFSPDGRILAAGDGVDAVALWNTTTGAEIRWLQKRGPGFVGKNSFKASLAFSPDGKFLASGNSDAVVRLWDVATGKEIQRLKGHQTKTENDNRFVDCYNALVFTPGGRSLVTENDNGIVEMWEVATGKKRLQMSAHRERDSWGSGPAIALSPDGKVLATWGWENTIRLWDLGMGQELLVAAGHRGGINSVTFAPDARALASGSEDGRVKLWDIATGKGLREWSSSKGSRVKQLAFVPDGRALAIVADWSRLPLWEVATGKEVQVLSANDNSFEAVTFAPNGRLLATSMDDGICLWDRESGRVINRLPGLRRSRLTFSSDGRLLAAANSDYSVIGNVMISNEYRFWGKICLWEATTGKKIPFFDEETEPLCGLAFSPDAHILATVSEKGTLTLWEVATGKERCRLRGRGAVAFSPNGRLLAAGSDTGEVHLWDVASGKEVPALKGHQGPIRTLAFSPDGRRLASAGADTTVLVWDVAAVSPAIAPAARELTAKELDALWNDLAADDAERAYQAVRALTAVPAQAVPLLRERVRPVVLDEAQVVRWIADLESDRFAVRQGAVEELKSLGPLAKAALETSLKNMPALETRKRLEEILKAIERPVPTARVARDLRAVEVLQAVASPEARRVLQALADGAAEARLTQEAKVACERLAKQSDGRP